MSRKRPECTRDLMNIIDPVRTAIAARSTKIPPLICLACSHSDKGGNCTNKQANLTTVSARWERQVVIGSDFFDAIFPDTRLTKICRLFKPEKKRPIISDTVGG